MSHAPSLPARARVWAGTGIAATAAGVGLADTLSHVGRVHWGVSPAVDLTLALGGFLVGATAVVTASLVVFRRHWRG